MVSDGILVFISDSKEYHTVTNTRSRFHEALRQLDFPTSAHNKCIALVRKSSFSKAQGLHETGPSSVRMTSRACWQWNDCCPTDHDLDVVLEFGQLVWEVEDPVGARRSVDLPDMMQQHRREEDEDGDDDAVHEEAGDLQHTRGRWSDTLWTIEAALQGSTTACYIHVCFAKSEGRFLSHYSRKPFLQHCTSKPMAILLRARACSREYQCNRFTRVVSNRRWYSDLRW